MKIILIILGIFIGLFLFSLLIMKCIIFKLIDEMDEMFENDEEELL